MPKAIDINSILELLTKLAPLIEFLLSLLLKNSKVSASERAKLNKWLDEFEAQLNKADDSERATDAQEKRLDKFRERLRGWRAKLNLL